MREPSGSVGPEKSQGQDFCPARVCAAALQKCRRYYHELRTISLNLLNSYTLVDNFCLPDPNE